jgi:nitroreductase
MLYDTLLGRRSIRQFEKRSVEKEKTETMLRAALLSPSSRNIRPWQFIVVDDIEIIQNLAKSKPHGAAFLKTAPLAIAVAGDAALSDVWVEDASIASCVLLLMAHELGLGACWCQIRQRDHSAEVTAGDYVKRLLAIPDPLEVESVIGIGYAAEKSPPYEEGGLLYEKLHKNQHGRPYPMS